MLLLLFCTQHQIRKTPPDAPRSLSGVVDVNRARTVTAVHGSLKEVGPLPSLFSRLACRIFLLLGLFLFPLLIFFSFCLSGSHPRAGCAHVHHELVNTWNPPTHVCGFLLDIAQVQ